MFVLHIVTLTMKAMLRSVDFNYLRVRTSECEPDLLKVQSFSLCHMQNGEACSVQPEENAALPILRPVRLHLSPLLHKDTDQNCTSSIPCMPSH